MTDIVLFGITGDLSRRRLIPALARLFDGGQISPGSRLIGFGRKAFSADEFSRFISEYAPVSGKSSFASNWHYIQSELDDKKGYEKLASLLRKSKQKAPSALIYISLPPEYQGMIAKNLFSSGALRKDDGKILAIEKPFGKGSLSAKKFDALLKSKLSEGQIYRVDHYAGKEELINIESEGKKGKLSYLGSDTVSRIELHFNEKGTAAGRGAFYDKVGALNDVCQNHMLHMLGTIMAAPYAEKDSYREMRAAAVSLLKPTGKPKLGQYASFKKEIGVDPRSETETYFNIENVISAAAKGSSREEEEMAKRWEGLHVTISGGKGLSEDLVDICFVGKKIKEGSLLVAPGTSMCIQTSRHGTKDAYQTIFESALKGDTSHSIAIGQVVAGWKYVEKVKKVPGKVFIYKEGTI